MKPRDTYFAAVVLLCVAVSACRSAERQEKLEYGLYVQDGLLIKAGKPYRGIGANYFSLFYRTLKDASDRSYRQGLRQLSEANILFVRFMCSGFWPVDWDLYLRDKQAYFAILDDIVSTAEEHTVGLIPSLFWNMCTVPDIVAEPIDQLGNPNSKACQFIRRYTEEIVTRYKDSPAIWGWEFGNEYNLHVDLPNAAKHRPPVLPKLKTALKRTERDELSSSQMLVALNQFALTVRKHDSHRIIITGNSIPRPSAYHNTLERSWTTDTKEQFGEILLRDNPHPFDTICVHIYPMQNGKYSAGAKTLGGLVQAVQDYARQAGKPLFIGEFGAENQLDKERERVVFEELLNVIVSDDVPLAAFWVFDYERQDKNWNVTFENDRAYMLELSAQANARMQSNQEKSRSTQTSTSADADKRRR